MEGDRPRRLGLSQHKSQVGLRRRGRDAATGGGGLAQGEHGGPSSRGHRRGNVEGQRQGLLNSSPWENSVDPGDWKVPRFRRTDLRTLPRDVLADPFLKELLRMVSVNTPKERAVAEVLYSLAHMTTPPDDHDSTDHSPTILADDSLRDPSPTQDSDAELWKDSFTPGTSRPSNPDLLDQGKCIDGSQGKVGVRGYRKGHQSSRPRESSGDGNAVTSSHRTGEFFGEVGVPVPRAKRSRTIVRKAIPDSSMWSVSSEHLGDSKEEGRRSRSSHNAVEDKPMHEHERPSLRYVRDLLVNVVPPAEGTNHCAPKLVNGTSNTAERDESEREGPVPASLKRSFRRNSAHSYIAHFIKWHKHQSKETQDVDWDHGTAAGPCADSTLEPGCIGAGSAEAQTTPGMGMDASRICNTVSMSNPPKQTLPVVWPTYHVSSVHQESATPKANPGITSPLIAPGQYNSVQPVSVSPYMQIPYLSNGVTSGSSTGRVGGGNSPVPLGHFAPFPSHMASVRLQGNQQVAVPNGEAKAVGSRGGMGMISGQCMHEAYQQ